MRRITDDLSPRSIHDIGCGEGSLLKSLAEAHPGAKASGSEIAENALALARRNLPGAAFTVCDVSQRPLDHSFDLVVCADVVEHIADDDAALHNMVRMTNPGGHVVVATLQGRMRRFEPDVGHVRNYAKGELEAKMQRAGLTIDRRIAWGFPLFSPLYRNLLEVLGNRGTMGRFGPGKKLLSQLIYTAFLFNSSRAGDYLFVRGRKA